VRVKCILIKAAEVALLNQAILDVLLNPVKSHFVTESLPGEIAPSLAEEEEAVPTRAVDGTERIDPSRAIENQDVLPGTQVDPQNATGKSSMIFQRVDTQIDHAEAGSLIMIGNLAALTSLIGDAKENGAPSKTTFVITQRITIGTATTSGNGMTIHVTMITAATATIPGVLTMILTAGIGE